MRSIPKLSHLSRSLHSAFVQNPWLAADIVQSKGCYNPDLNHNLQVNTRPCDFIHYFSMSSMQPSGEDGRTPLYKFSKPNPPDKHTRFLFVGNCGPGVGLSPEDIHGLFRSFGAAEVVIPNDQSTFVHVVYQHVDHAVAAHAALSDMACPSLQGRKLVVRYSDGKIEVSHACMHGSMQPCNHATMHPAMHCRGTMQNTGGCTCMEPAWR